MNNTPLPNEKAREIALACLTYLQYAMAGDIDSVEALNALEERHQEISWNDSVFIQFSNQVRGGEECHSPFENGANPTEHLRSLASKLALRDCEQSEANAAIVGIYSNLTDKIEVNTANMQKIFTFTDELFDYIQKLIDLHFRMRKQLELLDADLSSYGLPALPKPPQPQ
jgi:hypothetical protein